MKNVFTQIQDYNLKTKEYLSKHKKNLLTPKYLSFKKIQCESNLCYGFTLYFNKEFHLTSLNPDYIICFNLTKKTFFQNYHLRFFRIRYDVLQINVKEVYSSFPVEIYKYIIKVIDLLRSFRDMKIEFKTPMIL